LHDLALRRGWDTNTKTSGSHGLYDFRRGGGDLLILEKDGKGGSEGVMARVRESGRKKGAGG